MRSTDADPSPITMRAPRPSDARSMWELAKRSQTLDLNSPYAYLLAGHHFGATSVVAERTDGDLVGFVMAYRPPDRSDQVFVWQVAVDESQRGQGIARRMLHTVIDRSRPLGVVAMTATVTPSNDASRRLFTAVARDLGTDIAERPCFGAELFPGGAEHEPEHEIHIGPVGTDATASHPDHHRKELQ